MFTIGCGQSLAKRWLAPSSSCVDDFADDLGDRFAIGVVVLEDLRRPAYL
jgi:hypothetical protein